MNAETTSSLHVQSVEFLKAHRCFSAGQKIEFQPGVNLIVGDQGCGKSTLFGLLSGRVNSVGVLYFSIVGSKSCVSFDFEKDSMRFKSIETAKDGDGIRSILAARWHSHGESNNAVLSTLDEASDTTILADEPDSALSIRSCVKLVGLMKAAVLRNCQIITSVHNPIVIEAFATVFSLEHGGWMSSKDFIDSHKKAP